MKHILLDTTYVLPLFGIEVDIKNIKKNQIMNLWIEGLQDYHFVISDITLLEVLYKLNGDFRIQKDKSILHRYSLILPTILNIETLIIHESKLDPIVIDNANLVRVNDHSDYLDCLISGTALRFDAIFVTEDKELRDKLEEIEEFSKLEVISLGDLFTKLSV